MPHQETAFRRDYVLYWERSTPDRHGQSKVLPYIEVKVRWDDNLTLGRDSQGNPVAYDAQIVAAREFKPGSIVLHQTEDYYVGTGSEALHLELYEVVSYDKTPDIKNRAKAYVVKLKRFRGDFPEVVS